MSDEIKIVIIEDSPTSAEFIKKSITGSSLKCKVSIISTIDEIRQHIDTIDYDIVLLDYMLDGFTAVDALKIIRGINGYIPVMVLSGAVGEEKAIEVMKLGANDFIRKDNISRLLPAINRELHNRKLRKQKEFAENEYLELNKNLEIIIEERTKKLNALNVQLEESLEKQKIILNENQSTKLLLNTILENIPSKIYVKDVEKNEFIYANEEFCHYFNIELSEILGKNFTHLLEPEFVRSVKNIETTTISTGKPNELDYFSFTTLNGINKIVYLKIILIQNSSGALYILGIMEDITEEEIFKNRHKNLEAKFFTVFHASPVPVVITRLSDNNMIYVNKSFCDIVKYDVDEIIGQNSSNLNIWVDLTLRNELLKNTIEQTGNHHNINAQLQRKDNVVIDTIVSTEKIELNDEPMIIFMGIDITEIKQAERKSQETIKKQRELVLLKSQFVSMISHEYRTPLTSIMLSSDLLKRYGYEWNEDERNVHFQRIQDTIYKMIQMMENVLILGNIDDGKLSFSPDLFNLNSFCNSIAKNIELNYSEKVLVNVKFLIKRQEHFLDENLVGLIIMNLLTNAVKFSSNKSEVNFLVSSDRNNLIIDVIDYGIGIPTKDIPNIFNEFFRASNTKSISGYGLGLSIVKKSVEAHKGTISVNSKLGEGTKFTVTLPIINHNKFERKNEV